MTYCPHWEATAFRSNDAHAEADQTCLKILLIDVFVAICYGFSLFITPPKYRRDGVVVRASASQSVDLGFIPLVESYQKTLKNGIHSFPAWRSAFRGGCGEQAGKFACCVLE